MIHAKHSQSQCNRKSKSTSEFSFRNRRKSDHHRTAHPDYIKSKTGKEPLLRGFEMLTYSPNINDNDASEACLTEVYENRNTMETALKWAKATGGIVTLNIMFALANLYLAARKSLTV